MGEKKIDAIFASRCSLFVSTGNVDIKNDHGLSLLLSARRS